MCECEGWGCDWCCVYGFVEGCCDGCVDSYIGSFRGGVFFWDCWWYIGLGYCVGVVCDGDGFCLLFCFCVFGNVVSDCFVFCVVWVVGDCDLGVVGNGELWIGFVCCYCYVVCWGIGGNGCICWLKWICIGVCEWDV